MIVEQEHLKHMEEKGKQKSMDLKNFENLIQNKKLKEKLELARVLLEYINAIYLIGTFKIEMPDYNIIRIISEYAKIDEHIFNQMTAINALYERVDENGINEIDLEYLLLKIDEIYGYIKNKYGGRLCYRRTLCRC